MKKNPLPQRLKQAREARGLSQGGLAAALSAIEGFEVTQSAVSYWESGKNLPETATLRELCGVLGVSADHLLGLEGGAVPKDAARLAAQIAALPPARREAVAALIVHLKPRR